jgi:hypothetical protein
MTIFIAGLIRFALVVAILQLTFFDIESQWIMARLLAAVGAAIILFIGGGLLSISKTEHDLAVSLLDEAAADLEQQRQEIVLTLEKNEAQLMSTSRSTLLPQLDQIRELIVSSESRNYLVEHVRETIRTKVRPLSMELYQLAANIEPVEKRRKKINSNYSFFLTTSISIIQFGVRLSFLCCFHGLHWGFDQSIKVGLLDRPSWLGVFIP